MVGLAAQDRERAVELLADDDARQLVRERGGAERPARVGPHDDRRIEAARAADHEERALRRQLLPLAHEGGELLRAERAAAAIEHDDVGACQARLDPARLASHRLASVEVLQARLTQLDDRQLAGAREALLVVAGSVGERAAWLADADELDHREPRGASRLH